MAGLGRRNNRGWLWFNRRGIGWCRIGRLIGNRLGSRIGLLLVFGRETASLITRLVEERQGIARVQIRGIHFR